MSVKDEVDARHAGSQAAQARRDVQAYLEQVDPRLVLVDADGRQSGYKELAQGARWQFKNCETYSSSFERESFEETASGAVEVGRQRVKVEIRAFFVVVRVIAIERRSRLQWTRSEDGQLRITRLEFLEQDTKARFRFGFR